MTIMSIIDISKQEAKLKVWDIILSKLKKSLSYIISRNFISRKSQNSRHDNKFPGIFFWRQNA